MRPWMAAAAAAIAAGLPAHARAQDALPPLPAEPPAQAPPPPAPPPPPAYTYTPPPAPATPFVYVAPEESNHAPRYSLWLGGRLGLLGYGGGVYLDDPQSGQIETIGNFVRPGVALELNVGARLSYHYIPYATVELGLPGVGHRFNEVTTRAATRFAGIGFRYLAGDVDSVSFAADLSFGFRTLEVVDKTTGQNWNATAFETFRMGLGAEIRMNNHLTLSPMLTLSVGAFTDVQGAIQYAPNQGDGQTGPVWQSPGGTTIPAWSETTYTCVVLGVGGHFDLLGR